MHSIGIIKIIVDENRVDKRQTTVNHYLMTQHLRLFIMPTAVAVYLKSKQIRLFAYTRRKPVEFMTLLLSLKR